MMSSIRLAAIALLAVFVAVPACFAQQLTLPAAGDSVAQAAVPALSDTVVRHASHPRAPGATPGRAAIGGFIGGSWFYADADYSNGALPRFDFGGHWRYTFTPHLRGQLSTGFTWAAYSKAKVPPFPDPAYPAQTTKEGYLTQIIPSSVQLQWMWGHGSTLWHFGAGPNVTRVMVQNQRKVLKDAQTLALHRTFHMGVSGELGMERFFKTLSSTSVEVVATSHLVFAQADDKFPAGFNSNLGALCFRVGANYYFDTGLLKKKKSDQLPLSKAGGKAK